MTTGAMFLKVLGPGLLLGGLLLAGVSCGPSRSAPPPQQTAPALTPALVTPSPVSAPRDTAWDKVVEDARKEGKLMVYSSLLIGDTYVAVSKAFKEKYGIQVEAVSGVSSVMVERLRTEHKAKKYIADVWDGSQTIVMIGKDEGLLSPWGDLPALREKDVWFFAPQYDPEGYMLPWGKYRVVPYVETSKVKPEEEPKSYQDLLLPRWKGKKMAVPTPAIPMLAVTYATLKFNKVLDVDDYFLRLGRQELLVVPTIGDHPAVVARGEVPLAISGHESYFLPYVVKGAPLKALYMKEGVPLRSLFVLSLLKDSPHPNAGRLFVNWLMSREGMEAATKPNQMSPSRTDVPDANPVSKMLAAQNPDKLFPQNPWIDEEASRVVRERTLHKLLGLEK